MSRLLLIVAAGSGSRLGRATPKALVSLADRPLLAWTLESVEGADFARVAVAAPAERLDEVARLAGSRVRVVAGGATRSASVRAGVSALAPEDGDVVAVHDAARPLVTAEEFRAVLESAERLGAAAAATPAVDTIKRAAEGRVVETLDRREIFGASTPQAFRWDLLRRALEGGDATDEATLCEAAGIPVTLVPVSRLAFKITTPEDLELAEAILAARTRRREAPAMTTRVGIGFDAHPFAAGRELRLGGVAVPHEAGLQGHSDGDALLHALTDAILGAAALGTIGDHFPPSDPQWKNADSATFVARAVALAQGRGLEVGNVDAVVVAEAPRIAPHAARIRARVAEILGVAEDAVSVRGTSTNGLGFIGRKDGLAAQVIVSLVANPKSKIQDPK
ncbi:MAG TPA: 2-C-methyl-D-erythritol 4-phosphate cytidylyltransferase [Thermoanaerobaculia bacterium]|jgi:2-C-methyl-D-erythritol 4-phosphate cytidylyltransferase/2-C-methyl-D-erythritol 2,4-cyclodiphosphate synthase